MFYDETNVLYAALNFLIKGSTYVCNLTSPISCIWREPFPVGPMKCNEYIYVILSWLTSFPFSFTGSDVFSASTDGYVYLWDIRKLVDPVETWLLQPKDSEVKLGGISLDFESTMVCLRNQRTTVQCLIVGYSFVLGLGIS